MTTATTATLINSNVRRAARRVARAESYVPVLVTDEPGFFASCEGCAGYWTTPGGAPVRYPNAYRKAWGKPVYHLSTVRVEVGVDWRPPCVPRPRWAINGCP
jgi:hypothetical protein